MQLVATWCCPHCTASCEIAESDLHSAIVCTCGHRVDGEACPPLTVVACSHRGDEVRRVGCSSCGGHVQIKVLSCEIHGECTIAKRLAGVACCQGCGQRAEGRESRV